VVHVLTDVLRRVHRSLGTDGLLLVIQPAPVNAIIQMEIGGCIEFNEEFEEPNFLRYLEATHVAIRNVLSEQLFAVENEATTPHEGLYHCNEYDSIDEWVEDHTPFCVDGVAFAALSMKMRSLASVREYRIFEYWKEYKVLLRKYQLR
jgi:hypothetical protein